MALPRHYYLSPVALLTQQDAAKYMEGVDISLRELRDSNRVEIVRLPRIRGDNLRVRVSDLDRFLTDHSTASWTPLPRWGRAAVISASAAASFLGVTSGQLYGLARARLIPFKPRRVRASRYRFKVLDLERRIERWMEEWRTVGGRSFR